MGGDGARKEASHRTVCGSAERTGIETTHRDLPLALCCGRIRGSSAQPEYYRDDINKRKDEYDHEYGQEGVSDRDTKEGEAYDG